MIIDKVVNLKLYTDLSPLFQEVINYLNTHDLNKLEEGSYPVKGENVFLKIQMKKGIRRDESVPEYHKQMIDIQIPISGEETYGYTPVDDLPAAKFDEAKDIALVPGVDSQTFVTCTPGQMAIFFPHDGHAPCISEEKVLKKAIFKVRA